MYLPSKSNKQKNFVLNKFFVGVLKVNDGNSRICIHIRIHLSEVWIRGDGSGSTPKLGGSATLVLPVGDRRVRCKGGDLRPLAERVQVLDLTPPTQQRFQQGHQL